MLITACIIVAKHEEFIDLTLASLVGVADQVVIVGDPDAETRQKILKGSLPAAFDITLVWRDWDGRYGKARESALNYARGDWILQIDSDEVLSDNGFRLREFAKSGMKGPSGDAIKCFHLRYEHFIWNFGWLDATVNPHVGQARFFKKTSDVSYDKDLHELAKSAEFRDSGFIEDVVLWHLGYLKGVAPIVQKYKMNAQKSTIHNKEFLDWWRNAHLNGTYPVRAVGDAERNAMPAVLKKYVRGE